MKTSGYKNDMQIKHNVTIRLPHDTIHIINFAHDTITFDTI